MMMLQIGVPAGTGIIDMCTLAVNTAKEYTHLVRFVHSGTEVTVSPEDDSQSAYRRWVSQRRSDEPYLDLTTREDIFAQWHELQAEMAIRCEMARVEGRAAGDVGAYPLTVEELLGLTPIT